MSWAHVASAAFEAELARHEAEPPDDAAALGRRGARLALAESLWQRHLGGLLDGAQMRELLGVGSRQAVHDLVKRRRLIAVTDRGGRRRYPAAQLGTDGRPLDAIPEILAAFGEGADPWTVASWLASPQRALKGRSPAAWLRAGEDPEPVLVGAARTAARLAR